MSDAWSGGGSPRMAVPGRARGRQGKREKVESEGKVGRWADPRSGAQRQREKAGRVSAGGPAQRGGPNW
jgi:hypothetical protein